MCVGSGVGGLRISGRGVGGEISSERESERESGIFVWVSRLSAYLSKYTDNERVGDMNESCHTHTLKSYVAHKNASCCTQE